MRISPRIHLSLMALALCCVVHSSAFAIEPKPLRENNGKVEIKNAQLKPFLTVSVAAGLAGIIDEVQVQEGDVIGLGDVLVKVRDEEARSNHQRAKLALETALIKANRDVDVRLAEKSAEVAEQELNRTLKANELAPDTYPVNEVERYRLVWERSKIDIERSKLDQQLALLAKQQAEIEVSQTQQTIDRHTIKCRMKAMVVSVDKHVGEWVDPSTKILEVMSTERLRVEGFLDGEVASSIQKGRSVDVTISIGNAKKSTVGKVIFVSPIANPANGQVRIFVEIENKDADFRPGMSVTAIISPLP